MFIAEISPARIRGKLVTINQLAVVVGFMCSVIVAYFLSFGEYWRVMLASNALPVPFLIGGLLLVPESPRWLVLKNRIAEALDVLTLIDGRRNAEREMIDIANSSKMNAPWRELFQPGMRFALMIACTLAVLQQITGVSILLMYTPIIFQKAGFLSVSTAIYQNVLVSVWMVFCTVMAMLVVDRVGRKPLLLGGTALMVVGLALMGLFFQLHMGGFYIVLTMFISVGAYVMSLAPLAWLIMSEIFPNHLRDKAMTMASVCVWIASFLTAMYFPPLVQYFENTFGTPAIAFWIFAGVSAAAFLFSAIIVPEAKGRTLEELGASWTKNAIP
jgi:sugar porter (SP) family MFS transporter